MTNTYSQLSANDEPQGLNESVSVGLISLIKKIPALWRKPDPIIVKEDLERFLTFEIAKVTGLSIMKYSQKRLGKIHYNLMKDENYARELVDCQIKLHAEIVSDIGHLILQLLKCKNFSECPGFRALLEKVHADYVSSSPEGMVFTSCLNEDHFVQTDIKFRELALKTGKFLFHTLPMTDIMMPSDVIIFQGQIRFAYIHLLEQLGKSADYKKLRESLDSD